MFFERPKKKFQLKDTHLTAQTKNEVNIFLCLTLCQWCVLIALNSNMQERAEDTKSVIRSRKSKKDRQYNGPKKRDKGINNDQQSTTWKTAHQPH